MKSLISILAGIVVGVIVLYLVAKIGNTLLWTLMGIEPLTAAGAAGLAIDRRTESLLVVVAAYVVGPFAGGYIAGRLAPTRRLAHAAFVGAFQMILGVTALLLFPHPVWFWVATFVTFIPASVAGAGVSRV